MRLLSPTLPYMRKAKVNIRKVKISGKVFWQVTTPDPESPRPKRKTFRSKEDAQTHYDSATIQHGNFGAAAFRMSDRLRADATRAAEILDGTGKSLVDAARHLKEAMDKAKGGKPVAEAVAAFLDSRSGMAAKYLRTVKPRLEFFANSAGTLTTREIGTEQIDEFFSQLKCSPRTKSHHKSHLVALFNFCRERKWCSENPAEAVVLVKPNKPQPVILTPQAAADFLSHCSESVLPGVVLAMFCGIRQAELERLDWTAVNLHEGTVTIGAEIAKTNSRRVIPVPTNAKRWLTTHAKKSGRVWPDPAKAREEWDISRIRAGYGPFFAVSRRVKEALTDPATGKTRKGLRQWPANVLRHSAISYKVANQGDLAKVAYESGNSPKVIQEHYNGLAGPTAAKAYFGITPTQPANVTNLSCAA